MDTIQRFRLGWDGRRYAIPVYDDAGVLKNIRCYSNVIEPKIINWPGWGSPPRLYPMDVLLHDPKTVVICEGEFDALLANQQGIPTVTGTGGVKSMGRWRESWSEWFRDKRVYVCFDRDRDGDINARRVIKKLERFAKKIQYIELPFPMGSGQDLTDYLLDGGTSSKFFKLARRPKAVKKADPRYPLVNYGNLRTGGAIGKPVQFQATLASYLASQLTLPVGLKAACNMDWDPKRCAVCPMSGADGKMSQSVEYDHNLHLDLLGINKSDERDKRFKKELKIPSGCSEVEIETVNKTVWDSEVRNGNSLSEQSFPMLLFNDGEAPEVNHLYFFFGVPQPHTRGQRTIFIARKYENAKQDLDNFQPDDSMAKVVREWIGELGDTPSEKIERIAEKFEKSVTKIYGQRLLHMAIDLVYHSILRFKIGGMELERGWMEALAVGETRSGKSTTAMRMQKAYGYGQLKAGENTSVAGLLGGVEKRAGLTKDGAWAITAGELPLCDRRLLVIDEAQGLEKSHISQMSDVRSRGVVDIQKIRAGKIDARVRIIWLANERNAGRYRHNIDALSDQMGQPEDLARLDIPLYISGDVGDELLKARQEFPSLEDDEIDIIRWLVLWAWSRKPEQVVWSEKAQNAVHDLADSLADEFSIGIPVMLRNEAPIRLGRMATALAARLFASPDGHTLSVRTEHVVGAYELYQRFLSDANLGVTEIKSDEHATIHAGDEHANDLRDLLKIHHREVTLKLAGGAFDKFTFGGYDQNDSVMSMLLEWRAISMAGAGWVVHSWAKNIAKELEKEL